MATFILIDETAYETDTKEQIAEAQAAMREAGLTEAKVWAGDPEGDHVLNGEVLFAAPATYRVYPTTGDDYDRHYSGPAAYDGASGTEALDVAYGIVDGLNPIDTHTGARGACVVVVREDGREEPVDSEVLAREVGYVPRGAPRGAR